MTFHHQLIEPNKVHETLVQHMLVDGFPIVVDLKKSQGSWLHDAKTDQKYLDFFSFFASNPLGFNHPKMHNKYTEHRLLETARVKVSNSDKYTTYMAEFVDTLSKTAGSVINSPYYMFFIDGGALAIDNACKVALDYCARRNGWKPDQYDEIDRMQIIHFTNAFHGRSGFALSMTNTSPEKTAYFPAFRHWTRISSPFIQFPLNEENLAATQEREQIALQQIEQAFEKHGKYIAAICVEPVLCEGGNLHFRSEFFQELRKLADKTGALLIFDEVQTAMMTGEGHWWCWQRYGIQPDIICFAKKFQVGGILVSSKIDDVADHCFKQTSRINSTFGGSLNDMVRTTAILETIVNEKLLDNVSCMGNQLLIGLEKLQDEAPHMISQVRGKGLLCALDLPDKSTRDKVVRQCFEEQLIVLPCGKTSLRFLPAITVSEDCIAEGLKRLKKAIHTI